MTEPLQRQHLGCGYLPPLDDRKRLQIWQPPSGKRGYRGPELSTCPGFTTSLAEVREVSLLHMHWSKGNLAAVLGETATDQMSMALLIREGQVNAVQGWLMTPSSEGGGGS
jgi:hypothetical protein